MSSSNPKHKNHHDTIMEYEIHSNETITSNAIAYLLQLWPNRMLNYVKYLRKLVAIFPFSSNFPKYTLKFYRKKKLIEIDH